MYDTWNKEHGREEMRKIWDGYDAMKDAPEKHEADFEDREAMRLLKRGNPNGHRRFIPITIEEIKMHSKKNHDYTAGGDPLGNFDRVALILSMYPNLKLSDPVIVAMVYMLKQLDAVLWMKSNGHQAEVEGLDGRLADISIYAKIMRCMVRDEEENPCIEDIDALLRALKSGEGEACHRPEDSIQGSSI